MSVDVGSEMIYPCAVVGFLGVYLCITAGGKEAVELLFVDVSTQKG